MAENRKGSLKVYIKSVKKDELASLKKQSRARFATKVKLLVQADRLDVAVMGSETCSVLRQAHRRTVMKLQLAN